MSVSVCSNIDSLRVQDDNLTTAAAQNNAYRITQIDQTWTGQQTTLQLTRKHDKFAPPETFYTIRLLQPSPPTSVKAAGTALTDVGSPQALATSTTNAYYWDSLTRSSLIKIFDNAAAMTFVARF